LLDDDDDDTDEALRLLLARCVQKS